MNGLLKLALAAAIIPLPAFGQTIELNTPGASDSLRSELRQASLALDLRDDEDAKAQDLVAAARADYRRLLTALYTYGYYSGTVSIEINGREASGIEPLNAPRQIDSIVVSVDPGTPFTFGQTAITPLAPGTELPDGFVGGERARANIIKEASSASIEGWRAVGHAKAEVSDQSIVARHTVEQLDVAIALSPGPRLTFGPLTVTGNEDVRESAIRRIAGLPVGEVFSPDELEAAERRLRRIEAFSSAALVEAEGIGPNNTLPITAQIKEREPRRFGLGVELSSVEGLRLSTYWMHRNLFGGAERFRVEGEVAGIGGLTGGIDYRIGTNLQIPAIYGPKTDFLATATISREDEPDYLIDQIALETKLTRAINDDLTAELGVGLITGREVIEGETREYTLLTLPIGLEYDRRNDPTNATQGYYIDVTATPFLSLRGDADSGGRINVDARGYYGFGEDDRFVLAARTQIGSIIGADREDTPSDFLYFSGGGGTVRGQPYQSLGVETIENGETIQRGGASFLGAQLEARVGIRENISIVGFYDYGYVGETSTPGADGEWHAGTGIGVRYNTGIGPIRLDIGTPANGDDAFEEVQVYIGIGQAF